MLGAGLFGTGHVLTSRTRHVLTSRTRHVLKQQSSLWFLPWARDAAFRADHIQKQMESCHRVLEAEAYRAAPKEGRLLHNYLDDRFMSQVLLTSPIRPQNKQYPAIRGPMEGPLLSAGFGVQDFHDGSLNPSLHQMAWSPKWAFSLYFSRPQRKYCSVLFT